MKICLECGIGGHLKEILGIMEAFEKHEVFFVTYKGETTRDLGETAKTYYLRNGPKLTDNALLDAFILLLYSVRVILPFTKILCREKPRVIVTTGGDATVPICYIGKLFGVKIIYIESLARVKEPSGIGRLVYPVADLFLVQWEDLLKKYKKAEYRGKVI
jgi:UDP-N-acetylglucosamine:LPS N-acetylglucosamine transferase